MERWLMIATVMIATRELARADCRTSTCNVLVGPLFGVRLGGPAGKRLEVGIEGGVGWGPERINLGFEHRDRKDFGYLEIDPWYIVGGSLGVGIDSDGDVAGVAGLWEGIPVTPVCRFSGWRPIVTLAAGVRYAGVPEIYITAK